MEWVEAVKAFKAQVPVVYRPATGTPILCTRLAEISLRCNKSGEFFHVLGGMDQNENCIYHAGPERFSLAIDGGNKMERK